MHEEVFDRGIVETIHTHPTLSEGLLEAAQAACGRALHILPTKS
ncbi:MAG: hypothetical protein ABFD66_03090 [Smithella sp.]